MTNLKETLCGIAKAIVDKPEFVNVTANETDDSIVYVLNVHPDDMGLVIGKQGKIAKAIRSVVKAVALGNNKKKVTVDIRSSNIRMDKEKLEMQMRISSFSFFKFSIDKPSKMCYNKSAKQVE